ncbi:thiol-disulfide isomerase/thioredoxin [Pedobacter africanus]|uniref:Thiol-disulfide isomerase/thioredoxin n=1 Tax=Pedobacter africanus TaxID=151894 RepID=A0ACC6KUK4_9SPHI|nr:thioredoxin family protein [Pedobacter africanus]MDR6782798.1 thiol-disulfide isomerase/thioredoxin [Pedobacter africanus]
MKRFVPICFFLLYGASVFGQTSDKKGIQFFEGSWQQLLTQAAKTNKMIFIDVYTDWCGPCKYMDKFVFTEQAVGNKYNVTFINYKIDAEKGEGKNLAAKYNVRAYPTYLFLNSNGDLVHKVVGEREKKTFINIADEALKAGGDKFNLAHLEKTYHEGNRDPLFLRNYLDRLSAMNMDNTAVLDAYFKTIPKGQLGEDATLLYLANQLSGKQSASLDHLIRYYDKLSIASKEKTTNRLFEKVVRNAAGLALTEKRLTAYPDLMAFGKQLYGLTENQKAVMNRYDLMYYGLTRNYQGVKNAGYKMAAQPFAISADSLRAEDKRRFDKVMQPFISGEKDSTKTPGFEEEKKYLVNQYTMEIAEQLYTAAKAFADLPATEHQALADALKWAKRCRELKPDAKVFIDLVKTLEALAP